jgi:hypothetical protein
VEFGLKHGFSDYSAVDILFAIGTTQFPDGLMGSSGIPYCELGAFVAAPFIIKFRILGHV